MRRALLLLCSLAWGCHTLEDPLCTREPRNARCAPDAGVDSGSPEVSDAADASCEVGATESEPCGNCGTHARTCGAAGWSAFGACTGEKACKAGSVEDVSGGSCEALQHYQRACSDKCEWGSPACGYAKGWTAIALPPSGAARVDHSAVWTGTELIIWGGCLMPSGVTLDNGLRYELKTNTWKVLAAVPTGFAPRHHHSAVWTGSSMIIWGGMGTTELDDGAIYDAAKDSWSTIPPSTAISKRWGHGASWSAGEMLVWGGNAKNVMLDSGGRFNDSTKSWVALPPSPMPGRILPITDDSGLFWGGYEGADPTTSRLVLNGATYAGGSWNLLPASPSGYAAPKGFVAIGTSPQRLFVFGGADDAADRADGLFWDAGWNSVPAVPTSVLPTAARAGAAVWGESSQWLVWSGWSNPAAAPMTGGAAWDASTKTWTKMSDVGEPKPRMRATSVKVPGAGVGLIWGGIGVGGIVPLGDGAVYSP